LNEAGLQAPGGLKARFYNLGYPTLSTSKDLLLLDRTMEHQPDMILWLVTLESLVESSQLESPLLQLNSRAVKDMLEKHSLTIETAASDLQPRTFFDRTIIGSRVELSEWVRLQLYGFAWAATGVDHYIPESYDQRAVDLSPELGYKGIQPGDLEEDDLYLEVLEAGVSAAGDIPVVIINEPIFISSGKNSDIRYNFFYPRWVYDRYRSIITEHALKSGWNYVDYWDLVPAAEFTDSAIHYSSQGNGLMMEQIAALLQSRFGFSIDGR
jgi:hypothetical protein